MAVIDDTKATKNGPGTIPDALTAFEAQAVKLPAGPAPDHNVAVAYALGWAVGDGLTCAKYRVFEHLAKVPEFDAPADQWNLLVNQIISHCGHLNDHLESTHADFDLSAELKTGAAMHLRSPSGDVKAAVGAMSGKATQLHTDILTVLWSVASPLAKSYQLGHDMEQMCATPVADPSITVSASVAAHDSELHGLLTALASKLPANAAHSTDNSLRLWSASLSAGGEESPENLLRQGRRWYDVLAAEVSGKDGLRLTDYVAAADSVAGKLWQTARQVVARFKVWLVVIVLVAAGGIVLIVMGTRGTIGAGITAVLATFGLTWKGIGEFFGRSAAHAEDQLWNAEIDWAIAYRFTILRYPPADSQLKPRSKSTMDQPTKEHLRRYKQWKKTWPDEMTSAAGSSEPQAVGEPPQGALMQSFLAPVTTIEPRRTDPISLLYVRSYLILRLGVGVIGIALPFTLVLCDGLLFHGKPFPRVSISAYYYSGMRDLMIGAICSTGVFLLAYKIAERNLDNTLSLVGGVAALVAALSPPSLPPGATPGPLQQLIGTAVCAWTHFVASVVLLMCLGGLSFFFGLREGARDPRVGKLPPKFWRIFHWVCAGLIAAALIWMGLFSLFPQLGPSQTLLYGETLSLWAFGVSWLLKGLELDTLRGHPAQLLNKQMSFSPNRA